MHFNTIVLGGGPGGYTAAIRLAQLGIKVGLVEADRIGGTCLLRGCIPTKALLKSSKVFSLINSSQKYGIISELPQVDMNAVIQRKNGIVNNLVKGLDLLMEKNQVEVFRDWGKILNDHQIELQKEKQILNFDNLIIATGSEVSYPSFFPVNGTSVITSDHALDLEELPESILIIGGGVIGCEFASIYSGFGVSVTIAEMLDRILPMMDEEVSKTFTTSLKKRKVKILTDKKVEIQSVNENSVTVNLQGKTAEFSKVLIATGRKARLNGFGLENINIEYHNTIPVNKKLQTTIPHIYAIGDITEYYQLAHCASAQAIIAAQNISGIPSEMDYSAVPSAVYTEPGVASVGVTEQEALKQNIPIKTGKFPLQACGKAQVEGETDGFIKVICHAETEVIIGIHMVGMSVWELISEGVVLVRNKMKLHDVLHSIHPHPTLSESVYEAFENVHKQAIHILNS